MSVERKRRIRLWPQTTSVHRHKCTAGELKTYEHEGFGRSSNRFHVHFDVFTHTHVRSNRSVANPHTWRSTSVALEPP